jgi:hypothetical protein
MGVGLQLTGRYGAGEGWGPAPEDWLADVADWLRANSGEPFRSVQQEESGDGDPTLLLSLHPVAPDVQIAVPESGGVVVSAKTSSVGPGYHIYLCDLLRRLGTDFDITWDALDEEDGGDETGYFHNGDAEAVAEEMLNWLQSMAALVHENLRGGEYRWLMVSMGMGHRFEQFGPVVTPLGPRDDAWFAAVVRDPRRGIEHFPWWQEGINAPFYLGRALCQMWQEVRWRKPLNEDETNLLREVHDDLARARELDPTLACPWREWHELIGYLRAEDSDFQTTVGNALVEQIAARAGETPAGPSIGYRRRPVRVELAGGWSIEIPGDMAEEWDEGTWSAWDGRRTVWCTAFNFQRRAGDRPTAEETLEGMTLEAGERLEHRGEKIIGRASLGPHEEDSRSMWRLSARSAVAGSAVLCNVFFNDVADRDWAIQTWRSLQHQ